MSHYTIVAIFKTDPITLNQLRENLSKKYKYYLPDDQIKTVSVLEQIDMADNNNLIQKLKEYTGEEINIDEKGIYGMSANIFKDNSISLLTKRLEKPFLNFSNKFDYWNAFDLMITDDLLNDLDKLDRFPHVIFTPDCRWIEAPEVFMFTDASSSNYQSYLNWKNEVKKILEQYSKNSITLLIDCHI